MLSSLQVSFSFLLNVSEILNILFLLSQGRCTEVHFPTVNCDPMVPRFCYDNFREICRKQRVGSCVETNNKFDSIEDCNKLCIAPKA